MASNEVVFAYLLLMLLYSITSAFVRFVISFYRLDVIVDSLLVALIISLFRFVVRVLSVDILDDISLFKALVDDRFKLYKYRKLTAS